MLTLSVQNTEEQDLPQNINHVRKDPGVWWRDTREPQCSLLPGNHLFKMTEKMQQFVKRKLTGNMTGSANSPPPPASHCAHLSAQAHCLWRRRELPTIQVVSLLIWTPQSPIFGLLRPETILLFLSLFSGVCLGVCWGFLFLLLLLLLLACFEARSHYVSQSSPELKVSCLILPSAGLTGISHHT